MRISFKLNGTTVQISSLANERLSNILRKEFSLSSIKGVCLSGQAGFSTILMNGIAVPSTLIPVFKAENSEIITFEYFKTMEDYKIILNCFDQAGVKTCGFCDAGKFFFAYSMLHSNFENLNDSIENIVRRSFSSTMCRCTSFDDLCLAVQKLSKHKRRR